MIIFTGLSIYISNENLQRSIEATMETQIENNEKNTVIKCIFVPKCRKKIKWQRNCNVWQQELMA